MRNPMLVLYLPRNEATEFHFLTPPGRSQGLESTPPLPQGPSSCEHPNNAQEGAQQTSMALAHTDSFFSALI